MLLETISIGLLIPFVSTIISDGTQNNFLKKLLKFLNFEFRTKERNYFNNCNFNICNSEYKNYFFNISLIFRDKIFNYYRAEISNRLFQIYLNQPIQYYLDNNSSEFIRNIQDIRHN